MKLMFTLIIILAIGSSPQDETKGKFVGTWIWIKSDMSSRGGGSTSTPLTTSRTALVEITPDFRIKHIVNDTLICEAALNFHSTNENEVHYTATDNCSLGTPRIINDTLQFYRYLGCPSVISYYVRAQGQ